MGCFCVDGFLLICETIDNGSVLVVVEGAGGDCEKKEVT